MVMCPREDRRVRVVVLGACGAIGRAWRREVLRKDSKLMSGCEDQPGARH